MENIHYVRFNNQCASKNCPHYIEWEYEGHNMVSCKLQKESENITEIPDNCPFKALYIKEDLYGKIQMNIDKFRYIPNKDLLRIYKIMLKHIDEMSSYGFTDDSLFPNVK